MRFEVTPVLPRVAVVSTVAIALCALAGWAFGISSLKSVLPREAPVEPNTAFALLLAAGALWRLAGSTRKRTGAQLMAVAVLLVGLVTLAQHVFDTDFRIDELFFRDTTDVPGSVPGRMSPYSAVALTGIGLSLTAFNVTSLRPLVWTAAALAAFVGAVPIAGYLANSSVVLANRWLSPVAATVAFLLLGVGTIAASWSAARSYPRVPRSSVEKKVFAAFVGALLLLFIGAGFTYRASVDFAHSVEGISRTEQLRDALANLYIVLAGAESAQAAYLVTSRQQQRNEYERLVTNARMYRQSIAAHVAGDATHAADLAELDAHVDSRLVLLSQVTALYDENGLSSAREAVASDQGGRAMRAILAVTARMDARGEKVLSEREATLARTRQLTLGSLLLTLAIAAGIFLTLFRGISREMAARAQADEALRERNREILTLNSALAQRAAEVEAANKELESFSYSVSHDLRAPLRHIDGYIEMLRREAGDDLPSEPRRYLDVISDSSRRMSALIDDLLAFSRMGRSELRVRTVDLDGLVREVILQLEMLTRGRDIDWRIGPLGSAAADLSMLRQVFANLLGNALKYTRKRPQAVIEVACAGEENGRRIFVVRDNGVGFDMKHAAKLFGIFQRLHRTEDFEGTGIGLA
ncbi:MAG TPA: histidine kinase dimerization/phospho-acceptor domain-containing protein, partial [Burkholderiales bacterium]|nr:histidine kinase dimerization/phospho-acceptor domain-containing protein [Burkholderiales bacterium]